MTTLLAILVFGSAFAAMGVGLAFSGRSLRGSCGGADALLAEHPDLACGVCAKSEADLCPTDNELVRIAQLANPDPAHHR